VNLDEESALWKNFSYSNDEVSVPLDKYYSDDSSEMFSNQKKTNLNVLIEENSANQTKTEICDTNSNIEIAFSGDFTLNDSIVIVEDYLDKIYQKTIQKPKPIPNFPQNIDLNMTFFMQKK
jgi:hypothetical protein